VFYLSATLNQEGEWNFRIIAKRLLVVKIKSESPNKLVVLDVISGLIFPLEAPPSVNLDKLEINHEYISNIQVYSSKNLNDIAADFMNFFETLDVEQTIDDFIKAYWVYPSKLRFVLTEIEEA
jgi:hypothetical protein